MPDGRQVRRLRHRQQLTQKALGASMGWQQPYVSDLERGIRAYVQPATLARLAHALGVAMEALLTADERRRRAAWEEGAHGRVDVQSDHQTVRHGGGMHARSD